MYNRTSFCDHVVGSGGVINLAGVSMGYQLNLNRILLVGFALLIALAIPLFFIISRFLDLRETETWLSQLSLQRTSTAEPTSTLPPTETDTPSPTETLTPTPTPSRTPTPTITLSLIPEGDFTNAYIDDVMHLTDNGPQTMIKIITDSSLEGVFRAEINILWNSWDFDCFILGDDSDHLFCLGRSLPVTTQASIEVFELLGGGEGELVFTGTFEVPALGPTKTPKPTRRPQSTQGPTSIPTSTPISPTLTPQPTNTPPPTFTPSVTPTYTMGPPPTAWIPPTATPTP